MREIKFRCWDAKYNEWMPTTTDEIVIDCAGKPYFHRLDDDRLPISPSIFPDRWVISQYTGLEDKTGRMIYEGDILLAFGQPNSYSGVVDFQEGRFIIDFRPTGGNMIYGLRDRIEYGKTRLADEITGNIYENPQLVEASTKSEPKRGKNDY